jgi:hypothetical protein
VNAHTHNAFIYFRKMKVLQTCLLPVCFLCIAACTDKQSIPNDTVNITDTSLPVATVVAPDSFPLKKMIDSVTCKKDPTQSYALYIPSNKPAAVIYFFDPHASGALPLKKYKALADAYNFVLIGSNNSKNGNNFQTAENSWSILFNDTKNRIELNNNRIYVCGFSGGAKVASYLALHHPEITAVIAGGAGLPDGVPASSYTFSFTAIAGKGDMNMTDLVALNNAFDKTQTRHRIILFDGKHEWAPPTIMNIGFAGLDLDAMRNKRIVINDSLINVFNSNSKKRIDASIAKGDQVQASNDCTLAINMLDGLGDVSFFQQKNNSIINNSSYKNQLQQQQLLFNIEQNKKAVFNEQFQTGGMNYWNKNITELNAQAKGTGLEAAMNQRLLAYLSLAFYSISNQFINQNQNGQAVHFVTLYKMADPTNSEAWYFSAVLHARNNNAAAATNDLLKAVGNGFNDKQRLQQQEEFKTIQPPLNLEKIEAGMH